MRVDSFRYLPKSFQAFFADVAPLEGETEPVWADFGPRLADARIALLSSGGLSCPTQAAFDTDRERAEPTWGDPSWRPIPKDVGQGDLSMAHLHVNTDDFAADHEVAMPLRALDHLVEGGVVGASAAEHVSVMGYQAAGLEEWRTTTAPEVAAFLRDQGVDGVVLAPNCPDCCRNIPVLARHLEKAGVPTVVVTMMPAIADALVTPRTLGVEFPFGRAFGPAHDDATHRRVLEAALRVLAGAPRPGIRLDLDIEWPVPAKEAYKAWQPHEPSPLIAQLLGPSSS